MIIPFQNFRSVQDAKNFQAFGDCLTTEKTYVTPNGVERDLLGVLPDGTHVYAKDVWDEVNETWWTVADI